MRRLVGIAAIAVASACGPRHAGPPPAVPALAPPAPAPPGSVTVYGPLRIETIAPVRSSVAWERELARGARTVTWDVVLVQERAICPEHAVAGAFQADGEKCRGVPAIPEACTREPPLRARVEATARLSIDVDHRCQGEVEPWPIPAQGEVRTDLSKRAVACFRARNMLKPESAWASLYEVIELRVREAPTDATTAFPRTIARLVDGAASFCRDDGAYLDGTPGRAEAQLGEAPNVGAAATLATTLLSRAPLATDPAPLTGDAFRSEHASWEACNAPSARADVVAKQRCLLLRQVDRFLRDVEDAARAQTPKGSSSPPPVAEDGGAP